MIFQNLAEGREGSPLILYGRKLNSKGQPNNERQLSNKGQLNEKGQLVKKSNDVFQIPAEGREVSTLVHHGRNLNCKGQLSNNR